MSNLAPTLSSNSDDWYTPKTVFDVVRRVAPIGLDPFPQRWTPEQPDGFTRDWTPPDNLLTFCNPPYSEMALFVDAWARHPHPSFSLIALVPCRPDVQWFKRLRKHADRVCFWEGRIKFELPDGGKSTSAPFPSCVFYAGPTPGRFEDVFSAHGWVVRC